MKNCPLCGQPLPKMQGELLPLVIPEDLKGFSRWHTDPRFLGRWPELRAAWEVAYPDLDIDEQLKKAYAWYLRAPPRVRIRDVAKFLANWLMKSQWYASGRKMVRAKAPAPAEIDKDLQTLWERSHENSAQTEH